MLRSPAPWLSAVLAVLSRHPQPPAWLNAAELNDADGAVRDWLFDEGSLTRRLTELSSDAFSVQPLLQGWQTLREDECEALQLREGSVGWVREVYLCGHGQPWVFARSVAARQALLESDLDLETLGSRSLGELLFSDSAFSRGELQVRRYPAAWLPATVRADDLWARRSCFSRGKLGVLVMEAFLPALWAASQHQ
jgi:chorismate--pyruvate lyase